jgi:signal peptidase II
MKRIWSLYTPLFVGIVALDQYAKYYAIGLFAPYIITPWLSFSLVYNRGIATGIANYTEPSLFVGITILVITTYCLFIYYTWYRYAHRYAILSEMMILAGGFSNIIDRFLYAGVVDFIKIQYHSWIFPIFNVADMCIVYGVLLMFYSAYKES